jgi:hypothetical protein
MSKGEAGLAFSLLLEGLAFVLLLELDFRAPSCCFIYGNKRASLSTLMVATQQVWKNHDMGALDKERLTVILDLQKAMVVSYDKLL